MKTPSRSRVLAVGLCLVSIGVAAALAQTPNGPTPQSPDLLGIYPGMTAAAARAQLQKRSSTINVITISTGFSLNLPDPMVRESITVYLTQPPNDPAVWMIQRSQNFSTQNPMSQGALLTALREKYGKETLTNDRGGGGLYVHWIYDQTGKLLSSADAGLTGCMGINFVNSVRIGPPAQPNTLQQDCFRSFFAVTAMLNRRDAQLLEAYSVELVNLPYALKAATATGNANNAAADQSRRNQLEKGDQNKPKF